MVGAALAAGEGGDPAGQNHHRPTLHMAGNALHAALAGQSDPGAQTIAAPPPVAMPPKASPAPAASSIGPRTGSTAPMAASHATAPAAAGGADHGSTLRDLLHKGPLSLESALARIGLVAETVALQRTTVHGALTPWHVRFESKDATGKPRIAAPDAIRDAAQLAPYRAPELDKNLPEATSTPSAEVYALGCILFEAIAGRTPFTGTPAEQAKRHATAAAPPLRMVRRDCELPPALEVEIQRALKKRPGDRHPSATAFANAIRAANREDDRATMALNVTDAAMLKEMLAAAGGLPAAATAKTGGAAAAGARQPNVPIAGGPGITDLDIKGPPAKAVGQPAPKKGGALVAIAAGAIVVLGGGLAWVLLGRGEPPAAPVDPPKVEAAKAPEPDVYVAPDVAAPAVDVPAEPEVEIDVPPDLPDVPPEPPEAEPAAPTKGKGKPRPQDKARPPEPPKEEKKPDKKEDKKPGGGPAVF
ncbi:MAG: hypothetical protein FJ100_00640 [Deltaproteobacteria bacterium]|nr:hypothetical protein [Deltaproteobacteria bacterium]